MSAETPPPGAEAGSGTECVARFEVHRTQVLAEDSTLKAPLPDFARDPAWLIGAYRAMVLTRLFDAKAVALQRTGQLGTYPSSLGQEATAVALGRAMRDEDVLLPFYRDTGTLLLRGVAMRDILLYWGGDERGMAFEGPRQDFPISVPIASHAPQAVGVAYALKQRGEARAAVCTLGDGATSKGDFYEALNAAGVWDLPLVFLVINNEWAISVPRSDQSRAQTLAQKAIAAGIPGEQVDGDDLIGAHQVLSSALDRARNGGGPFLVEALTYRRENHTTADDARRYRSEEEVQRHAVLDPVDRVRKYLVGIGAWSDTEDETLHEECRGDVEAAVEGYLATPPRAPESIFDCLFATLPAALVEQVETLKGRGS